MNGAHIQTRPIERSLGVRGLPCPSACRDGFGRLPWLVRPRAEDVDRSGGPVSRLKQWRFFSRVVADGEARLEIAGHPGQSAARTAGSRTDRTNAGWWKPKERREPHLLAVRSDVACSRRLRREMHADPCSVWPMARKNTDTPTVSIQHAHRVNGRRMMQFWTLIDTPTVSERAVFDMGMTRPPCPFIDIPTQGVLIRGEKHSLQTRTAPVGSEVQS